MGSSKIVKKRDVEAALSQQAIIDRLEQATLAPELEHATKVMGNRRIGFRISRTKVYCEACGTTVSQSVWKHFGFSLDPAYAICPWLKLGAEYVSQLRLPNQSEVVSILGGDDPEQIDLTVGPPTKRHHGLTARADATRRSSRHTQGQRATRNAAGAASNRLVTTDNTALLAQQMQPAPPATGSARAVLNYDLTTPQGRAYALLRRTEENLELMGRYQRQIEIHLTALDNLQQEANHFMTESAVCLQELRSHIAEFVPANGIQEDSED
eukprot:TRINITY_DN17859_c0_g1_i1.p1 TRINITY_DN17859_c0_g1~~TRINITY_DN17859_c0_g1_i1.p1  ORF type:complete len:268 (+),score=49.65 TRINITY_DN17859_c0_g1_i1:74-877(+)